MSEFIPQLSIRPLGNKVVEVRLGHELLDNYLRFVAARCRPNSVLAAGYDLKVFFTVVRKEPVQVAMTDILEFIAAQRLPVHGNALSASRIGRPGCPRGRSGAAWRHCRVSTDIWRPET